MDLAMYIVDFAHHLHMLVRNYQLSIGLGQWEHVFKWLHYYSIDKKESRSQSYIYTS